MGCMNTVILNTIVLNPSAVLRITSPQITQIFTDSFFLFLRETPFTPWRKIDIHHAEWHIALLAYDINLKRQNRSRLDQPAEFWLDFRLN